MSRIHEALKKAEQERAAAQPPDNSPSLPSTATEVIPKAREGSDDAPSIFKHSTAIAPQLGNLKRFEDLCQQCAHPHWHPDPKVNIFSNPALSAIAAEQFRTLRSRLYQLRGSQQLRTLLVASSVPAEGKTFVTNNLAQAIVRQHDRRCLIIDADLRCSRLHVPLGAPPSPGLTDYLLGEADETTVIQHGHEGNLCFIPGGKEVANPSELLLNGRLKTLLERVTPIFDWIILDSPPLLPVADASLLADHVDGVILVVRAASTPTGAAERACQELQGRNVIGVVLNAVEQSQTYGSYYYAGYEYGQEEAKSS
ncbi:MAG: CpsD/CapB family tyrosine-protein kinase [Candidatus Acidiferrales bacterium]